MKVGYIAVVGRPNVGKSTLINALLGEKLMAVSAKPQTTRHRVLGIKNVPGGQLLFLDTPGIHRPHKALNDSMLQMAQSAVEDADVFLFVREPDEKYEAEEREIYQRIASRKKPILVVINKADKVYKPNLLPVMEFCMRHFPAKEVIPLSALKLQNLEGLEREIVKYLPEGPALYPEEQLTDQPERFFVTEVVREKIMELTKKEVPYSVAVVVEEFRERPSSAGPVPGLPPLTASLAQKLAAGDQRGSPVRGHPRASETIYIRAVIIVEKDSQKGILIGKGGKMIKEIGMLARKDLEERLAQPLFLELFVRVEADWTKDPNKVREFSYRDDAHST